MQSGAAGQQHQDKQFKQFKPTNHAGMKGRRAGVDVRSDQGQQHPKTTVMDPIALQHRGTLLQGSQGVLSARRDKA